MFDSEIRRSEVASDLMRIAPGPSLPRHDRTHDRVPRVVEVLCRVPSGRRVAATDVAASQTLTQRHPRSSLLDAFLAKVLRSRRRKTIFGEVLKMPTNCIHVFVLSLGVTDELTLFESFAISYTQKHDAEQVMAILPILHQLKSGPQRETGEARQRVLVGIFRGDVLSLLETKFV